MRLHRGLHPDQRQLSQLTRRAALLTPLLLFADSQSDVLELVAPLATALSNGDAVGFLSRIPDDAPDRERLQTNIRALTAQGELTSSVQIRNLTDDKAELDWYMEIRGKITGSMLEERRGVVTLQFRKKSILSLTPVDYFRPAEVR